MNMRLVILLLASVIVGWGAVLFGSLFILGYLYEPEASVLDAMRDPGILGFGTLLGLCLAPFIWRTSLWLHFLWVTRSSADT